MKGSDFLSTRAPSQNDLITAIKDRIDIAEFMAKQGYTPIWRGRRERITLKEHDSFVYDPTTRHFWWNARGIEGDIIDLYEYMRGCSRDTALREMRAMIHGEYSAPLPSRHPLPVKPDTAKTSFELPKAHPDKIRQIYGYLIRQRCIEPDVVKWLNKNGYIFADERRNLCYASRAYGTGQYDYCAKKGTFTDLKTHQPPHFRQALPGGNYDSRFTVNMVRPDGQPNPVKQVFVCEAAVDAFSIMSLLHRNGRDFTRYGYISLEGCYEKPAGYHLEHHPEIQRFYLAQDNDEAGNRSRLHVRELLLDKGFAGKIIDKVPPTPGRDWNRELQSIVWRESFARSLEQAKEVRL